MRWPLASTFLLAAAFLSLPARADGPPPAEAPSPLPPAPAYPPFYAPPLVPYAPYGIPVAPAPDTERRSKGMMVTGIVLWAAGGVATAVGTAVFVKGLGDVCYAVEADAPTPGAGPLSAGRHARRVAARERVGVARQAFDSCGGSPDLGFGVMTAGILSGLAAIPIYLVGNMRVPAKPHADDGLVPAVHVGLGSADLHWSF